MTVLLVTLIVLAIGLALAFKYGGTLEDRRREREGDRKRGHHRTEVFSGQAEPAGLYGQYLSGLEQEISDPAVSQIAGRVLHAPTRVSKELIEAWVAEFANREPGEVDSSGRFRFRRIRDGEEIDGTTESDHFDYSVLSPVAVAGTMSTEFPPRGSSSPMGTMEEGPAFVLIKRTPLSISFSIGLGAGEFDPTDVASAIRWVENRINEPNSKLGLWIDVFETRGRALDQITVEDALVVPYDLDGDRAVWPPVGNAAND